MTSVVANDQLDRSPMFDQDNGWTDQPPPPNARGFWWIIVPDFPLDPHVVHVWSGFVRGYDGPPSSLLNECQGFLWNGPVRCPRLPEAGS